MEIAVPILLHVAPNENAFLHKFPNVELRNRYVSTVSTVVGRAGVGGGVGRLQTIS